MDRLRQFRLLSIISPFIMVIGGILYFIPRNPTFFGTSDKLDWGHLLLVICLWGVLAGLSLNLFINLAQKQLHRTQNIRLSPSNIHIGSVKEVLLFFLIATFLFGYFEAHFCGWYLRSAWELLLYPIVLIPYFTVCYLAQKWIPQWGFYALIWIVWGIIWDTIVPGFESVPNIFTWHQWLFAPATARFIIENISKLKNKKSENNQNIIE